MRDDGAGRAVVVVAALRCGRRGTETEKVAKGEREKSGGGSKSGDREIMAQKDEKQSSGGPRGSGSMCRHNERSQTYRASLISTIKATFFRSAALLATSPVCKSPHLSPQIKTSEKERARLVEP